MDFIGKVFDKVSDKVDDITNIGKDKDKDDKKGKGKKNESPFDKLKDGVTKFGELVTGGGEKDDKPSTRLGKLKKEDEGYSTASEVTHNFLDFLGMVPVLGAPADVANAALHAAEGEGTEAALSLVGTVPFAGDAIKGGVTVGKLGGKLSDAVKGSDKAEDAADLGKNAKDADGKGKGIDNKKDADDKEKGVDDKKGAEDKEKGTEDKKGVDDKGKDNADKKDTDDKGKDNVDKKDENTAPKRTPEEAKNEALRVDGVEGGHTIKRHGPEVDLEDLKMRITEGKTPGGGFSPQSSSGRFNSYENILSTRDDAWANVQKENKVDLSKPPGVDGNPKKESYKVTSSHDKVIGDGYMADPDNKFKGPHPKNPHGKHDRTFWRDPEYVGNVTETESKVVWNDKRGEWEFGQHYPSIRHPKSAAMADKSAAKAESSGTSK